MRALVVLSGLLSGCTVTVFELGGPWDIDEQQVSTGETVEGFGFMDFSEEARYYAWGWTWYPGEEAFIATLDPPVLTEASISSLDLDEQPQLTLRYGDNDFQFEATGEGRDIVLTAADPWNLGVDLEVLLTRP